MWKLRSRIDDWPCCPYTYELSNATNKMTIYCSASDEAYRDQGRSCLALFYDLTPGQLTLIMVISKSLQHEGKCCRSLSAKSVRKRWDGTVGGLCQ